MIPYVQSIVRAEKTSITTDPTPRSVERIHVDYDPTNPGFSFNPGGPTRH
jgi:hypothetical protein